MTHVPHFYTRRNLHTLASVWRKATSGSLSMRFLFEQLFFGMSKISRYVPTHYSQANQYLSGTLYVGSQVVEVTPKYLLEKKIERLSKIMRSGLRNGCSLVTTQSTTSLTMPGNSIDYIFTDPPFGSNLMYAELNYCAEAWHKVKTNMATEAIENPVQNKGLLEYQTLMLRCFSEYYRVLKPGRWMTVEFHNSQNRVWEAIREALQQAGFVIADVRTLDKIHSTFKQITSSGAVKQDLVISAYKPRTKFEKRFEVLKGKTEAVIDFVAQHLSMLPVVPVTKEGRIETLAERTRYVLYDRMLAYHLMHNSRIPVSAAEFYEMLENQFISRDDMYFLPDQAARYDAVRVRTEVEQLALFVRDERSAVQWVRSELDEQPQTLGELTPKFMQAMQEWDRTQDRIELAGLLTQYFVQDTDERWRVPNPNIEKDMEQVRRKTLLSIFERYVNERGPLRIFRREALLEGFKECWHSKQYAAIIAVCNRLPNEVLQENPDIKQFYDIARDRLPEQPGQMTFQWK